MGSQGSNEQKPAIVDKLQLIQYLQVIQCCKWAPKVLCELITDYYWVVHAFHPTYGPPDQDRKQVALSENNRVAVSTVKNNTNSVQIFGRFTVYEQCEWTIEVKPAPNDETHGISQMSTKVPFGVGMGWVETLSETLSEVVPTDHAVLPQTCPIPLEFSVHEFYYRGDFRERDVHPWSGDGLMVEVPNLPRNKTFQSSRRALKTTQRALNAMGLAHDTHLIELNGVADRFRFYWDGESILLTINDFSIGAICTLTPRLARVCRPMVYLKSCCCARFL